MAHSLGRSCAWTFRRNHCYLIPGNSPIGYRLPLNSLPALSDDRKEFPAERSPFEDLPALGDFSEVVEKRYGNDCSRLRASTC